MMPIPAAQWVEHPIHERDHLLRRSAEHRSVRAKSSIRCTLADAERVEDADARPHLVLGGAQLGAFIVGVGDDDQRIVEGT